MVCRGATEEHCEKMWARHQSGRLDVDKHTRQRKRAKEGTSRVSNRIQKIGKSAEQSEGSRKAGTNRHQQLTYTSDSVASSAVPIRSSRTLTQEGKGHGRGRAAENTKGQKRKEEAKRSKNGVQILP